MARPALNKNLNSVQFWVLVAFLVLVFVTGGGARADIQSLLILRPVSVLVCVFGLWTIGRQHIAQNRFLFGYAAALFGLAGLHLIPLPPSVWGLLPGREIIVDIDRAAGLGQVWRPISMAPSATWNAFYSLFVPFAVLLLGVQLRREERYKLLPVVIGLGLLSGFLGLLQVVSGADGPLYLYQITNPGSAVGLFSNRNHAAVLLASLFPMLAVFAIAHGATPEQTRFRLWAAVVAGLVLVPLILVTGSRAGVVVGVIGLVSGPFIYRKLSPNQPSKRRGGKSVVPFFLSVGGVVGVGLLTALLSRAQAFERLLAPDQASDLRWAIWKGIPGIGWQYFPMGSGVGSFVEVYRLGEPDALLSPIYINHAHNDWLEIYLTGGAAAIVLAAVAVGAWLIRSFRVWRTRFGHTREMAFGRMASVAFCILAIASIVDYPLRVPSMMALAVIFALWLQEGGAGSAMEKRMPQGN